MAGDVDLALQQIAITQGGMDGAAAKRFLVDLAKAGRYQRDVYKGRRGGPIEAASSAASRLARQSLRRGHPRRC